MRQPTRCCGLLRVQGIGFCAINSCSVCFNYMSVPGKQTSNDGGSREQRDTVPDSRDELEIASQGGSL